MTRAKRIRWECPNGLHPGVLGSTRPPLDSIVRYCVPCSLDSGRLVKRVAPALERKRAAGSQRAALRQQTKAQRERAAKLAKVSATVTDREEPVRIDKLLQQVWRLNTRKVEAPNWPDPPSLLVRRGNKPYSTGHCWYGADYITVTIGKHDYAEAVGVIIHEAAHEIAYRAGRARHYKRATEQGASHGAGHGTLFKSIFRSLVSDWTGVPVADPGQGTAYDFHQAMVRHLRDHPRDDR